MMLEVYSWLDTDIWQRISLIVAIHQNMKIWGRGTLQTPTIEEGIFFCVAPECCKARKRLILGIYWITIKTVPDLCSCQLDFKSVYENPVHTESHWSLANYSTWKTDCPNWTIPCCCALPSPFPEKKKHRHLFSPVGRSSWTYLFTHMGVHMGTNTHMLSRGC